MSFYTLRMIYFEEAIIADFKALGLINSSLAIIDTTLLAATKPYVPVTKQAVPRGPSHVLREDTLSSFFPPLFWITSSLKTAQIRHFLVLVFEAFASFFVIPFGNSLYLSLNCFLHQNKSLQWFDFVRSSHSIFVGSTRPAAPPQVTILNLC